jgi:hypothetical protein
MLYLSDDMSEQELADAAAEQRALSQPAFRFYTIRYTYPDGRTERQGCYAPTEAGLEMAVMNARLARHLGALVTKVR